MYCVDFECIKAMDCPYYDSFDNKCDDNFSVYCIRNACRSCIKKETCEGKILMMKGDNLK